MTSLHFTSPDRTSGLEPDLRKLVPTLLLTSCGLGQVASLSGPPCGQLSMGDKDGLALLPCVPPGGAFLPAGIAKRINWKLFYSHVNSVSLGSI